MGDFQSSSEGLRIEYFQSFDKGFGFLDFLDLIEDFFQPLCIAAKPLEATLTAILHLCCTSSAPRTNAT